MLLEILKGIILSSVYSHYLKAMLCYPEYEQLNLMQLFALSLNLGIIILEPSQNLVPARVEISTRKRSFRVEYFKTSAGTRWRRGS